jgi:uncharacterized protein YjbI with pentapeptide repeats
METQINENHSYKDIVEGRIENTVFINCQFVQTLFSRAKFFNCSFIACNFSLASFGESQWERCVFKSCDFIHASMKQSVFEDCHLSLCNFDSADFEACHFGITHSELCSFNKVKITKETWVPATSREFVGAIIRNISESKRIQAVGAYVNECPIQCWEGLREVGEALLSKEEYFQVVNELNKFPNFANILSKYKKE